MGLAGYRFANARDKKKANNCRVDEVFASDSLRDATSPSEKGGMAEAPAPHSIDTRKRGERHDAPLVQATRTQRQSCSGRKAVQPAASSHRGRTLAGAWLAACLALGAALLFRGLGARSADPHQSALASAAASVEAGLVTKPIEQIRVGERVVGENPLLSDSDRNVPDPDPATWRVIRLRMQKQHGGTLEMELLRPLSWIAARRIRTGTTVELDLPELGVSGPAQVLAVGPSPAIQRGAGPIVTGTFRHSSKQIIDLRVEGQDAPIVCTPEHPFWSEDRQDFIAAGQLRIGERLRSVSGHPLRVAAIARRERSEVVYNIEVHRQRVFSVSSIGILVHNNSARTWPPIGPGPSPRGGPPRDTHTGAYLPEPDAVGPHTTLGTRIGNDGVPYTQGATFDADGNFLGRTDVTDHGRPWDHGNPHFHPATSPSSVDSGSHAIPTPAELGLLRLDP